MRGRDASARAGAVVGFDDLGAGRAPVASNAVAPRAKQHQEKNDNEHDEQNSSQPTTSFLVSVGPHPGDPGKSPL